jgi:hypothetical protein
VRQPGPGGTHAGSGRAGNPGRRLRSRQYAIRGGGAVEEFEILPGEGEAGELRKSRVWENYGESGWLRRSTKMMPVLCPSQYGFRKAS